MKEITTDVLVVGGGPAGLAASALLARQGVSAITVSKHRSTANTPRSHITNQRTMEIMRDLGIEREVYNVGLRMKDAPNFVWTTTLAGREIARRFAWGTRWDRRGDYDASSPCDMANISQMYLEPVLLNRASALGADVRFNTEFLELSQDDEGVTAVVTYRPTGEQYSIRARFVLGTDGGRSRVASEAGFEFEGPGRLGYAINAHIDADLSKFFEHRPAAMMWTNRPGREYFFGSGAFAAVKPWTEWVVLFNYDPEFDPLEATEDVMLGRVQDAIGDPDVPVTIKAVSAWELQARVATSYRQGRVLIAGDAAHRHTPANGLGSNTSIQDAYNIAWKLAAVTSGRADDALLDSYEAERLPVGQQVVARATESVGLVAALPGDIGINGEQSEAEGWAAIDTYFSPGEEGRKRREMVRKSLKSWDYGINCHGVEMGQRYASSNAVADDGTEMPPYEQDPQLVYQPTTHPGAALPHAWVLAHDKVVSTLDLVPADTWTVITGPDGQSWVEAARSVSDELGLPIAAVAIGPDLAVKDSYGEWTEWREITDGGCVLVRPDKFVGYRSFDVVDDPAAELRRALELVFGRVTAAGVR